MASVVLQPRYRKSRPSEILISRQTGEHLKGKPVSTRGDTHAALSEQGCQPSVRCCREAAGDSREVSDLLRPARGSRFIPVAVSPEQSICDKRRFMETQLKYRPVLCPHGFPSCCPSVVRSNPDSTTDAFSIFITRLLENVL